MQDSWESSFGPEFGVHREFELDRAILGSRSERSRPQGAVQAMTPLRCSLTLSPCPIHRSGIGDFVYAIYKRSARLASCSGATWRATKADARDQIT